MRLGKLRHLLRHQIGCADDEWDKRQAVIARLRGNRYSVQEAPNPCRLYARKGAEEFIIDITGKRAHILPVRWVGADMTEAERLSVVVTDIPDTGRYGIRNEESKYYDEVKRLVA